MALAEADLFAEQRRLALRGVGIILISSVLFGAMAVCVRLAARELPSTRIAWVRFTGSLLLLLVFARGTRLKPRPGNLLRVLQRALLGCAAITLYFFAIEHIGAGLATLLHCTYPIPTAVLAVLVLGEPASWRLLAAIAINLLGILLVVAPGANLSGVDTVGVLSALAASTLAGGAVATARHLRASEDASLITIYFMGVGAVLTAPSLIGAFPAISPTTCIALTGVVVTSAAGQWLLHHGLGFTSAVEGSLACATSVITAAALEAMFLGEHLGAQTLAGAVLMVVAVGLAASRR